MALTDMHVTDDDVLMRLKSWGRHVSVSPLTRLIFLPFEPAIIHSFIISAPFQADGEVTLIKSMMY